MVPIAPYGWLYTEMLREQVCSRLFRSLKHLHAFSVDLTDEERAFGIDGHKMGQKERLWIAPTGSDFAVGQIEMENLVDVTLAGEHLVADDEQAERIAEAGPFREVF